IFYPYGDIRYDRIFGVIQWFLGVPSPYALPLVSATAFFCAVVLLYRIVRPEFGPAAAASGFVILVFWPTFVAWSISMLKESVHLLLSAVAVAAAIQIMRVRSTWARIALALIIVPP